MTKCPACNSTRLRKNQEGDTTCLRCGYKNSKRDATIKIYGEKDDNS